MKPYTGKATTERFVLTVNTGKASISNFRANTGHTTCWPIMMMIHVASSLPVPLPNLPDKSIVYTWIEFTENIPAMPSDNPARASTSRWACTCATEEETREKLQHNSTVARISVRSCPGRRPAKISKSVPGNELFSCSGTKLGDCREGLRHCF